MSNLNKIAKLKLFIEAAEMIGGDGWTPQPSQWATIRNKIMDLEDEPEVGNAPALHNHTPIGPGHHPPVSSHPVPAQTASLFDSSSAPAPFVPAPPMLGPVSPAMSGSMGETGPATAKFDPNPDAFL